MIYFKKAISLLIILVLSVTFCSCSEEQDIFIYEVSQRPKNIDPLLASTPAELTIIKNTFEGLTRINADGEPQLAAAKKYSISDDMLTYTFTLRDDLVWNNGTPLTADDFVFAVQRAADPKTKACNSDAIKIIEGGDTALLGKTACTEIAFRASDKTTLVIKLSSVSDTFLETLAQPSFMPCNREFFNSCKGKYGLSSKHILSNGRYELTRWQAESSIRLTKSDTYKGKVTTKIPTAFITFKNDESNDSRGQSIGKTTDSDVDLTEIDYTDINQSKNNGLKILTYYNKTYALVFNKNDYIAASPDLLYSFTASVDRNILDNKPDYLLTANNLIPPDSRIGNDVINKLSNRPVYSGEYSKEKARSAFLKGIGKLNKKTFPKTVVLCPDNADLHKILTNIISCWQNNLGAYLNIEKLSEEQLLQRVESENFTVALVPLSSDDPTAISFLSRFTSGSSQNYLNLENAAYDKLVDNLMYSNPNNADSIIKAEKILLDSKNIVPVVFYPTIYAASPDLKRISVSPFDSTVDFSFVEK